MGESGNRLSVQRMDKEDQAGDSSVTMQTMSATPCKIPCTLMPILEYADRRRPLLQSPKAQM